MECKNREASGAQNPFGNNDYHKKAIYHQVTPPAPHQAQTAHGRDVIEGSKRACLVNQGKYDNFTWDKYLQTNSKVCLAEQDDEKLAEGFCWDNFCPDQELMAKEMSKNTSNVNAFIVNAYDLKCAEKCRKVMEAAEARRRKLEEEEEEEERLKAKTEAEKKRRAEFLRSNRTIKDVPEFEVKVDAEPVKVSEKCMNCDSLIKQNNELLHNINKLKESYDTMNREINKYTDSNGEQVVAMNTLKRAYLRQLDVNFHIKKCAELELKLETQRIETERVNKLLESYSCSTFVVDRIYPVVENLKTFEEVKTSKEGKSVIEDEDKVKISGKTTEAEKEQSFRKQINQEFLAKKQEDLKKNAVQKKIESRTCFQCKTAGHIARNCPKTFKQKQEVSGKLKEKIVEKTELTTKNFTGFENSTFEIDECSKNVIKRKENLKNKKWIVKVQVTVLVMNLSPQRQRSHRLL
ncbi:putative transcription factor interactor and regulator CCHC(Zn) family [Helianthus debilis subsp. tardiflorus]